MKNSDNLHTLIKSLSKSEKRHFKLFATTFSSQNNYLKLFDAIDEQSSYDEEAIKKKFAEEPFTKQLHVTKNYLAKQVLKSLGIFSTYHSRESELRSILRNLEILFRRELYQHFKTEIARAERIASQYELFTMHLDVLSWKRKLLLSTGEIFSGSPQLSDLFEKEQELIEKKRVLNTYWQLVEKIPRVFSGGVSWNEIMSSPFAADIKLADSVRAKILYHHILYSYNVTVKNSTQALIHINKLILLLELNPHRIIEEPSSYITSLNNKIGLLLDLKEYDSISTLLQKIRSVPTKYNLPSHSSTAVRLLLRTHNVELELYRDAKQFEKGAAIIEPISDFISKNEALVSDTYKQMFYYQFAYIRFNLGSFTEALKWTNEIINGKFKDLREDILSYARILNMAIHYELNNPYVLRYAVESTRRFLKKKRNLLDHEKTLLKFFSKISVAPKSKHKSLFENLGADLFKNTSDEHRKNILDYFDFDSWIQNKLG